MTRMSVKRVCEGCAEEVDPDDPSLVRAGLSRDAAPDPVDDEPDVLFHAHCFPTDNPVWVRR
jgi:hypothetical protein